MKKQSKQPISAIQRALWNECKRIIRARYKHTCYTCGRTGLRGANLHTGHMLPKASVGAYLKYDLRNLRPQCYNCNINLGGNGAVFIERMRKIEGDSFVNSILADRNKIVKAYDFYVEKLIEYEKIKK